MADTELMRHGAECAAVFTSEGRSSRDKRPSVRNPERPRSHFRFERFKNAKVPPNGLGLSVFSGICNCSRVAYFVLKSLEPNHKVRRQSADEANKFRPDPKHKFSRG